MAPLPDFHGIHVAPLQATHERLDWLKPANRCRTVRVRQHTCDCRATFFEFCTAGGLSFIRRSTHDATGLVVHETPWVVLAEGCRVWQLLLRGQAR